MLVCVGDPSRGEHRSHPQPLRENRLHAPIRYCGDRRLTRPYSLTRSGPPHDAEASAARWSARVNNGLDAEPDPWTRVEDVNHMVRFKPIAAVVIAAALALTGCSGSAKPPGGGTASTTADSITIAVTAVPGTFQVSGMVWTQAALFAQATYDSLVMANGDGTVSPSLASKWSYNDTKTELTMTLRSGVKFTDGTPLNAE